MRVVGAALLVSASFIAVAAAGAATPSKSVAESQHRLLVGYFPQWGLYNEHPYTVKQLVESGAAGMLDHLNYAQGFVTNGRCSVADPNADLNYTFTAETSVDGKPDSPTAPFRGNFHQLVELKRMYPRMKILISLEGHAPDFAADAQPEVRAAFVASCVDLFLKGNFGPSARAPGLFDGIDIDWEYPRGEDAKNYVPLLREFRRQMDAFHPGLLLSVALGPSPHMYGDADIEEIGRLADVAGLMTYDFNGPWSSTTGLIAPLSTSEPDEESVERSVTAWKDAGIPADKLLVGLPFYGYAWHDVGDENHGLGQDGKPEHDDHPYREIQRLIRSDPPPAMVAALSPPTQPPPPVVYRDPKSQAPWLFDGDSFWTYDDPTSIRSKASYVASQQLGGFMVWELGEDTSDATLLRAAHRALASPLPLTSIPLNPSQSSSAGAAQ